MLLLLFATLAAIAPKYTPAAIASLGLVIIPQAVIYLPVVHYQRPSAAPQGTVFTSPALLDEAEERAARFELNTLARRQLLAKADQIMADGGNEGNARFGWESGPLYLAYAYQITGERKYADLAAQVLKKRTLSEQPELQNREDYSLAAANEVLMRSQRTTARAQTYALLSGYSSADWTSADKEGLRSWLRSFANDMKDGFAPGTCITNAKWFHLEGIAAAGAAIGDKGLLDFAFKSYRRYLDGAICAGERVIGGKGLFDHEMRRFAEAGDDTWYYAGYSMLGMVRLAEIARNQGVNLYDYTSSDGRNLRKALDAHVPYLLGEPWPHSGGEVSYPVAHREFMQAYEIAYVHWPDPDYLKVLEKFGDKRRASELTDCLGNAAYLFANSNVASSLPPGVAPEPTTSAGEEVFGDGLAAGWTNSSWDTLVNLKYDGTTYDGKRSIAIVHKSRWAGFRLHRDKPLATEGFDRVSLWIHGGTEGGQSLQLYVESDGTYNPRVRLPVLEAKTWALVEVSLADLGAPAQIRDIAIQENGGALGRTFFVDQIRLAGEGEGEPGPRPGASKVLYETWSDVRTTANANLDDLKNDKRYPSRPSTSASLASLEAPFHQTDDESANYYGSRMRTLVVAPVSGEYELFLSGDDTAELLLSTDGSPEKARVVATIKRWVYRDDFLCERSEAESCGRNTPRSGRVSLVAGKAYYLEVNHLESVGEDHVSVAWRVPGSETITAIPGDALRPIGSR